MSNLISVPFHGANLFIATFNNEPYTPMKPIIDGMGMDWASQFTKLKQRFSSTIAEITIVANDGKSRKMICLPLRKLAGWLQTISPNKVNHEIRDKVIQYQNECDDVLYEYWTTGEVKSKSKTTVDQRTPLRDAVNLLVSKKALTYSEAYSVIHQRFNVASIEDLPLEQLSQAIEYVHHIALEGEYIERETKVIPSGKVQVSKVNITALINHMEWIYRYYKKYNLLEVSRLLQSDFGAKLHDHIIDGYLNARSII